jgi:hypothetical protein
MRRAPERNTATADRVAELSAEVLALQARLSDLTEEAGRNDALLKKRMIGNSICCGQAHLRSCWSG